MGPFLAHKLIQRLTHSNPSADYIARVARIFNDNGSGIRGDLKSVIWAILSDPEIWPTQPHPPFKLKEPILAVTQLARVLQLQSPSKSYITRTMKEIEQGPLRSPSVFNFFSPDFTQGKLATHALVAPELELLSWSNYTFLINAFQTLIFQTEANNQHWSPDLWLTNIEQPLQLLQLVNDKLLGNRMSQALSQQIQAFISSVPNQQPHQKTLQQILHIVVASPEFMME
jgi:hypothetical protein